MKKTFLIEGFDSIIRELKEEIDEEIDVEEEDDEEEIPDDFEGQMDYLVADEEEAIDGYDKVIDKVDDEHVKDQLEKIETEEEAHKDYLEKVKEDPTIDYEEPLMDEEKVEDEEVKENLEESYNDDLTWYHISAGDDELIKENAPRVEALCDIVKFIIKHFDHYDDIGLAWFDCDSKGEQGDVVVSIYSKDEQEDYDRKTLANDKDAERVLTKALLGEYNDFTGKALDGRIEYDYDHAESIELSDSPYVEDLKSDVDEALSPEEEFFGLPFKEYQVQIKDANGNKVEKKYFFCRTDDQLNAEVKEYIGNKYDDTYTFDFTVYDK